MSSRTRTFTSGTSTHAYAQEQFDLDAFTDDELETLLFQDDEQVRKKGSLNLATLAGLSMVLVSIMYVLNYFLNVGLSVGGLVTALPIIAGVLIAAMGFGLIRMDPKKKKIVRSKERRRVATPPPLNRERTAPAFATGRVIKDRPARRLKKSRNRKIFGVASGIAEYFGWDPTLVRAAFVLAAFVTGSIAIPLYLALAFFLPNPDAMTLEERIQAIRDS